MFIKESYASYGGRQRKAARSRGAHPSDAPRKHQKAGEEEVSEVEVFDLVRLVHAKLTIQLESRMMDMVASMYCTVLLPSENEIVKVMQSAGRHNNYLVEKRETWNEEARTYASSTQC